MLYSFIVLSTQYYYYVSISQFIFWPLFPPTKYCWEVTKVHVFPLVRTKTGVLRLHVYYSGCTIPPSTFPSKSTVRCIVLIILIILSSSPIIFLHALVASSTPPSRHPIITGTTSTLTLYLLFFSGLECQLLILL